MHTPELEPDNSGLADVPDNVSNDTVAELIQTSHQALPFINKPDLTAEQTQILERGRRAEAVLYGKFAGLTKFIARKEFHLRPTGNEFDDARQGADEYIIRHIRSADISRLDDEEPLRSMVSHIAWGIRRGIREALWESDIIKLPGHVHTGMESELKHGQRTLDLKFSTAARRARRPLTIDSGNGFGTSREYTNTEGRPVLRKDPIDKLESESEFEDGWLLPSSYGLTGVLNAGLVCLSKREQEIVLSRIVKQETLQTIGDRHGVIRERIRQIETKAYVRLYREFMSMPRGIGEYIGGQYIDDAPRQRRYYVTGAKPKPEEAVLIDEAMVYRLGRLIGEFKDFKAAPQTVKRVVNHNFLLAQRLVRQGKDLFDISDVLHEATSVIDEDLVSAYAAEQDRYVESRDHLEDEGMKIPDWSKEVLRLSQELEIDRRLTKELTYGTDRFEAHITGIKGKAIELERLQQNIDSVYAQIFYYSLDDWLSSAVENYNLSPRLSQTVLSTSLQTLRSLAEEAMAS